MLSIPSSSTGVGPGRPADVSRDSAQADDASAVGRLHGFAAAPGERARGEARSVSSEFIERLREQIAELQERLRELHQQLDRLLASGSDAASNEAAVAALQLQIADLTAALQATTAALLQALQDGGGANHTFSTTA